MPGEQYLANVAKYQPLDGFDTAISTPETKFQLIARDYLQRWDNDESPAVGELFVIGSLLLLTFMALPALNLINLNLSRVWERRAEVGLRKAMGARAGNLIGQLLVEI